MKYLTFGTPGRRRPFGEASPVFRLSHANRNFTLTTRVTLG
uniref:Uncharacterized protein n=1 Tax=Siphoviridae sp. ct2D011 TaxID=2825314 RepID=A0A8S5V9I9_9CAUD|nr:MAG TPA: hypothetical protein [Siphoviridae sp. ct2D011]